LPVLAAIFAGFSGKTAQNTFLAVGTEFAVYLEIVESVCSKGQSNKDIYDYQ
jgi:hypothetical protein